MGFTVGCNTGGDTDGGPANDDTLPGGQFVSDGGAGGSLSISLTGPLTTAGTTGFFVTATDPSGAPLAFIRIFCETEKGIAILEPISGGTSFEHTGPDGVMSGLLGGLVPGSYILECRAPEGFNLVAREQIIIRGSVPDGFVGFPGATGGNLGGDRLVDRTPDEDDGAVRISSVTISDGGDAVPGGPIDLVQSICDIGTDGISGTSDDEIEPFFFTRYSLTIANDSPERVFIGSLTITISDGRPATSSQVVTVEVPPGGSAVIDGLLTDLVVSGTIGGSKTLAGSSFVLLPGTFPVTIALSGTDESGSSISLTDSFSLTFDSVNNCPA